MSAKHSRSSNGVAVMRPTILSRRAQRVPKELLPTLGVWTSAIQSCKTCQRLVKGKLVCCNYCQLPLYCSGSCQQLDCTAHEQDGICYEIKEAWTRFYLGNDFWADESSWKPRGDCESEFAWHLACHPTSAFAVERSLLVLLTLKNDGTADHRYNLDARVVSVLLKLYREDDAVGLILYWLNHGPGKIKGDVRYNPLFGDWERDGNSRPWPFPIIKDARFADLSRRFRRFPEQRSRGISVPIEFALAVLVIKMRFITVYRKRAEAETLFLKASGMGELNRDLRLRVLSFLVEGGQGRYLEQLNQVNCLMDYVDERDATLLPGMIDPAIQAQRNTDQISFETFLQDYANGEPVIDSIKCLLTAHYQDGFSSALMISSARYYTYRCLSGLLTCVDSPTGVFAAAFVFATLMTVHATGRSN